MSLSLSSYQQIARRNKKQHYIFVIVTVVIVISCSYPHGFFRRRNRNTSLNGDDQWRNNLKNLDSKPLLVIQAGPTKTGTTFIQNTLAKRSSRDVLAKDNYMYVGGCNDAETKEELFFEKKCLHMKEEPISGDGQLTPKFRPILQQMKDEKKNAIYALEYARLFFQRLATLTNEIDIRIIVTYRRLYEWLPSQYSENFKYHGVFNTPFPPRAYDFDLNEDAIRNFVHQTRFVIDEADRLIGKGNYSLQVIDMHAKHYGVKQDNNLLVELLCTGAVPNTIHTCRAAKNDKLVTGDVESNIRLEVHYQLLAYKAHQLGILKQQPSTEHIYQLKECLSKDKDALSTLPKVCMSEDHLEKLYNLSWEHERRFYPERSEHSHRTDFEEYRNKGKFCSLDVDSLLTLEAWQRKISACEELFFSEEVEGNVIN